MLGAYKLLSYWGPAKYIGPLVFYGIMPWLLFALNLCGVDVRFSNPLMAVGTTDWFPVFRLV
jgi:hypothetical protein